MAEEGDQFDIVLTGGAPWGFRLQGGREFRSPLQVAKVSDVQLPLVDVFFLRVLALGAFVLPVSSSYRPELSACFLCPGSYSDC